MPLYDSIANGGALPEPDASFLAERANLLPSAAPLTGDGFRDLIARSLERVGLSLDQVPELRHFSATQYKLVAYRLYTDFYKHIDKMTQEEALAQVGNLVNDFVHYLGRSRKTDEVNTLAIARELYRDIITDTRYQCGGLSIAEMKYAIKTAQLAGELYGVTGPGLFAAIVKYAAGEGLQANNIAADVKIRTKRAVEEVARAEYYRTTDDPYYAGNDEFISKLEQLENERRAAFAECKARAEAGSLEDKMAISGMTLGQFLKWKRQYQKAHPEPKGPTAGLVARVTREMEAGLDLTPPEPAF